MNNTTQHQNILIEMYWQQLVQEVSQITHQDFQSNIFSCNLLSTNYNILVINSTTHSQIDVEAQKEYIFYELKNVLSQPTNIIYSHENSVLCSSSSVTPILTSNENSLTQPTSPKLVEQDLQPLSCEIITPNSCEGGEVNLLPQSRKKRRRHFSEADMENLETQLQQLKCTKFNRTKQKPYNGMVKQFKIK